MPGVPTAQDDAREKRMVDIFNLERAPEGQRQRHGTDAFLDVDGRRLEFELKSATRERGGISTVRDFGPDHVAKWRNKHWIVGIFIGEQPEFYYASPNHIRPWIIDRLNYIKRDFKIAKLAKNLVDFEGMYEAIGRKDVYSYDDAKALHKNQYSKSEYMSKMDRVNGYSAEKMLSIFKDRVRYVVERGATLNNPHIPPSVIAEWPRIQRDHAQTLRHHVREWIASRPQRSLAPGDTP